MVVAVVAAALVMVVAAAATAGVVLDGGAVVALASAAFRPKGMSLVGDVPFDFVEQVPVLVAPTLGRVMVLGVVARPVQQVAGIEPLGAPMPVA